METTKKAALQWVINGKPCQYRSGWAYRGARARSLTNADALRRLQTEVGWDFDKGFYQLNWKESDGSTILEFNELSACDME